MHVPSDTEKKEEVPIYQKCAELLENVFSSESTPDQNTKFDVLPFTIEEIQKVLKSMRKGRYTDKVGIALEMFVFGVPC